MVKDMNGNSGGVFPLCQANISRANAAVIFDNEECRLTMWNSLSIVSGGSQSGLYRRNRAASTSPWLLLTPAFPFFRPYRP